jgi:thiosulfate/3-mercaptopyruvate sulfurtransferase
MDARQVLVALGALLVISLAAAGFGECAEGKYNYITIEQFKARLDAGDHEKGKMAIVTTQTPKEYATGYLKAAYATFARPLESGEDFAKLDPFLEKVRNTTEDIILICPRGKSGAERPFDYFAKKGVSPERMLILKDGMETYTKAYPNDVLYGN